METYSFDGHETLLSAHVNNTVSSNYDAFDSSYMGGESSLPVECLLQDHNLLLSPPVNPRTWRQETYHDVLATCFQVTQDWLCPISL
jgi:hypothetical protein